MLLQACAALDVPQVREAGALEFLDGIMHRTALGLDFTAFVVYVFFVSFHSSLVALVPFGLGHVEQASLFVCFPSNVALRSLSCREL